MQVDKVRYIDEHHAVAHEMIARGGSFVEALGRAMLRADDVNLAIIKEAWPELWDGYRVLSYSNSKPKEDAR